jgi:putative phage-type endonuclease
MFMRRTHQLPPIEDNNFMEWGRRLEDAVAQKYADETQRKVERNGWMLQSVTYPWLTATPDYDILGERARLPNGCLHDRVAEGLLECKTANHYAIDYWSEGAPPHYRCQVQHQMVVTGRSMGSLACLIGGNQFRWIDEDENKRFQSALIKKTETFMKMVRGELPPPLPDAHPSTSETLQRMIADGRVVELPDAIVAFHEGYQQALRDEKDAKDRKDQYANALKAAIGTAEYGILPNDLGSYSFKMTKGHTIVIPDGRRMRYSKKKPKVKT